MIAILSSITGSMKDTMKSLDDLQQASIKAYGKKKKNPPQLTQIVEIRQTLQVYWRDIAKFMKEECYQTANKVRDLQEAGGTAGLIEALQRLETAAEKCSDDAKVLVGQHDEFIQFFGTRGLRLSASDPVMASFTNACEDLRTGLIDLDALIEEQRQACATGRKNYRPAMLETFKRVGEEWNDYVKKIKEISAHIKRFSDDIGPGVEKPRVLRVLRVVISSCSVIDVTLY